MPRIKPLTEAGRKDQQTIGELAKYMAMYGYDWARLADYLDIGIATAYRRRSNPSTWTLKEIRGIKRLFPGITIE